LSVCELLSANLSGPRRFGCGTVGDYLIGIKVVLSDGRVISPGGKVVKNVAGYDLAKLFIGSRGSLGVIVEATFKLRPLPEAENFIAKECKSLDQADALIEGILNSELTPVVFDLHNLFDSKSPTLVLGFAGTREEVDWQSTKARELGFNENGSLNYESQFWSAAAPSHRLSVLPSKAIETIKTLNGVPFIARAGNGIIYYRDDSEGRARHSLRAATWQESKRRARSDAPYQQLILPCQTHVQHKSRLQTGAPFWPKIWITFSLTPKDFGRNCAAKKSLSRAQLDFLAAGFWKVSRGRIKN
jgi:hypothetical protein